MTEMMIGTDGIPDTVVQLTETLEGEVLEGDFN